MNDKQEAPDGAVEELFAALDRAFDGAMKRGLAAHPPIVTADDLGIAVEAIVKGLVSMHADVVDAAQRGEFVRMMQAETQMLTMVTLLRGVAVFLRHSPQLGERGLAPMQFLEAMRTAVKDALLPSEIWSVSEVKRDEL